MINIPPLANIYLNPTDECNLACRHCWVNPPLRDPKDTRRKELALENIKKAIEQAIPLGLRTVKLTGGEPLLYSRFEELLEYLNKEKGLRVNIESNGTLITPRKAKAIQEYAGFVAVSLDGAKEDTHERMRVIKGSFKASLEGIKNLVAAGIRPQVVFCITQWNKHEFRDLIMMCKELGCKNMKVNKPTHIARGENLEKAGELLTIKQILDYYKIARQYSEELDFEIIYSVPPAFKPLDRVAKESGCKCSIHRLLGITGDGTISMCGIVRTVDNLSMGNIKTADLAKVWNDDPILNRIRDEIPDRLTGICQNCIHKKACMAYCVALNYFDMGQLTAPFKFCQDAHEEGLFPRTRLIQKVAHI